MTLSTKFDLSPKILIGKLENNPKGESIEKLQQLSGLPRFARNESHALRAYRRFATQKSLNDTISEDCFAVALCRARKWPLRERRLKAGKMLRWSILSESPSSCAAKGLSEYMNEASGWSESGTRNIATRSSVAGGHL